MNWLPTLGKAEEALDAKIVKYVKEHHDDHGLDTLRDEDGNTMLIAAVRYSNLGAVKLILNVGEADITLSNSKGATALHSQQPLETKPLRMYFWQNVVHVALISKRDDAGNTAAMYALAAGKKKYSRIARWI